MQELRAALILVPPLLADLVRHVAATRAANLDITLSIIAKIDDPAELVDLLGRLAPDLVIFGPSAAVSRATETRLPRGTRVLTLSADLKRILGPDEGESAPLTPESLAQRLREISRSI
ncbi:MAG: hypothetical protein ACLQO1_07255 [Steroidobacteraceae bacterium]